MNLELTVNDIPFQLGQAQDSAMLKRAATKKRGVLRKVLGKLPFDETEYFADNCAVKCFGEGFIAFPCTDSYLDRDRQWRTAASLYYHKKRLVRVGFQVIAGKYAAANFLDRFLEACEERFGEPAENGFRTVWEDDDYIVAAILSYNRHDADFEWALKDKSRVPLAAAEAEA